MKTNLLLLVLLFSSLASATDNLKCRVDNFGYVSLNFKESIGSGQAQEMELQLGQESDWNNPYQMRTKCENLKKGITSRVGERWSDEICDTLGLGIRFRQIGFQLNSKAAKSAGTTTLWFSPREPSSADYYDKVVIPAVNSNWVRIIKPATDPVCHYPAR